MHTHMHVHFDNVYQNSKIIVLSKCTENTERKRPFKNKATDGKDLVICNPSQLKNLRTIYFEAEAGCPVNPN